MLLVFHEVSAATSAAIPERYVTAVVCNTSYRGRYGSLPISPGQAASGGPASEAERVLFPESFVYRMTHTQRLVMSVTHPPEMTRVALSYLLHGLRQLSSGLVSASLRHTARQASRDQAPQLQLNSLCDRSPL